MWAVMSAELELLCEARGLELRIVETHTAPSMPCAPWLTGAVVDGIRSTGDADPMGLWSRAGHDGMAIGAVTDIGMLFVRCFDGVSHHPDEAVREVDVAAGLDALEHTILCLAEARR
jgi:allantoate deiminase